MKKVIIATFAIIIGFLLWDQLFYYQGVLYLPHDDEIVCSSKVAGESLYIDAGSGFQEFQVKGVNLGLSKPGFYATEDAISKEEYIRWFGQIQEMGANVIRIYTIASPSFYDAFYVYNEGRENPLYLFQGVAVSDYLLNSVYSVFDDAFYEPFLKDCKRVVDIVHGRYKEANENGFTPYHFDKDISPWVVGYMIGSEWEGSLVAYSNYSYPQLPQFNGDYLYTENANNFEIFLADIGDQMIAYETKKYGTQRLLSFTNRAMTDPLLHEESIKKYFKKAAEVDVETIRSKETFQSGQFAAYHVYPAYPDFYSRLEEHEANTYLQYLKDLNTYHSMPVVIAEFGASSSRALSSEEAGNGRNQGGINETAQGEAVVSMYEDIMAAGSCGGILSNWQDEWYKRSWNTIAGINLDVTAYWSDYQSCEQGYGMLSFDPGKEKSVCYVDGQKDEWQEEDLVSKEIGVELYMKYDEKFIYFMVKKDGYQLGNETIYIPIDVTPKSGSNYVDDLDITLSEKADFVIAITDMLNSRVLVHERYDTLSALFFEEISAHNFFSKAFPLKDSTHFSEIHMLMQNELYFERTDLASSGSLNDKQLSFSEYDIENPYHYIVTGHYETGKLTYGNANPASDEFNSLADFCAGDGFVEIKVPWQLLNFADPVNMYIHDDYYEHYGVEYLKVDSISVGAGTGENVITMEPFSLDPLGKHPVYHERLKQSYYILQEYWTK